ncbi:MAG TPA: restriction endonuclease subunit S [Kofleriaceae bacterium]|nr:restriction endonuclease subunit S [Kofleriaceae bacterium]
MTTLPRGWAQTTLAELLDRLQYGYTASASSETPGPRLLRITDLQEDGVDWTKVPGCQILGAELEKYRLRDGDFVFARSGSIEKAWRVKQVPTAVFASYLIRGTPLEPATAPWLEAFVRSTSYLLQIGAAGAGIGMQNVNAKKLGLVTLPLPPLNEQHRIVAKLNAIFEQARAATARLERLPVLLEKLKRSVLAAAFRGDLTKDWRAAHPDVEPASALLDRIRKDRRRRWESDLRGKGKDPTKVRYEDPEPVNTDGLPGLPDGWGWATIGQLCDVGTGATPKRGEPRFWSDGNIPWVTSGATNAEFIDRAAEFVTQCALDETNLTLFPSGTLLVAMYGEGQTRGRCAELRFPATTNQAVAALVTSYLPDSLKDVIKFVLWDRYEALRMAASGGVQPNLNLSIVRNIVVPVPPLLEQAALVDRVREATTEIQSLASRVEKIALRVRDMEQAALTKALRGELVSQDPTDEPASLLLDHIRAARAAKPDQPRRGRDDAAVLETSNVIASKGRSTNGNHDDSLDLVVATFQADRRLTATAITEATGLDASAVKKALKVLVDAGQVRSDGSAQGKMYEWTA